MKLYYSPGACSLACRISLHEGGFVADFERVDLKAKTTEHGHDYLAINPKGYVPMLMLDDGQAVTEIDAVLDYLAGLDPDLAPDGTLGRTRLLEMLSYLSTELHVAFKPFWHRAEGDAREAAVQAVGKRLAFLETQLRGPYLFGAQFTAADAYLFVMLRWARGFGLALPPGLVEFFDGIAERSTVRRSLAEEGLD